MTECSEAIERAFRMYERGDALVSVNRIFRQFGKGNAWMFAVAGAITPLNRMVLKALPVNWDNPEKRKLPHMYGVILLCEQSTGIPLSLMDATHITNMRTGALAGIGAKYLARKGSETLGVIGSRDIARYATIAVTQMIPSVKTVKVYSRTRKNRELFASELREQINSQIVPAQDSAAAIEDADIVVTATSATSPVLHEWQIKDGMFIAALGSPAEIEPSILARVKVVAEAAEECKTYGKWGEALKRGLTREEELYAEIAEVVAGRRRGRTSQDEVFLLDSVGLAIEDAILATLVYDKAVQNKVGTNVEMYEGLRLWQ